MELSDGSQTENRLSTLREEQPAEGAGRAFVGQTGSPGVQIPGLPKSLITWNVSVSVQKKLYAEGSGGRRNVQEVEGLIQTSEIETHWPIPTRILVSPYHLHRGT